MLQRLSRDRDLVAGGVVHTEVTDEMLSYVDVLVDGEFVEAEKDLTLQFRGSRNQRILELKKLREQGKGIGGSYRNRCSNLLRTLFTQNRITKRAVTKAGANRRLTALLACDPHMKSLVSECLIHSIVGSSSLMNFK